jgi:WD40 repeat protein
MIFSSTGSFIVSRVRDGTVRIWSLDGKPTRVLKTVPIGKYIQKVTSPYSYHLMLGYTLILFLLITRFGQKDNVIQFTDSVESLAISPDDGLLVGGTREGTIYLWEVYTGRLLGRFPGHDNVVYSVTFAPDGRGFLSGSWDNTIKYHKIDFDTLHEITDSTSLVRAAEGENDLVKCECTLTSHTNSIVDVSISPDGQWIVSASLDSTVMIWDSNGTPHLMLRDHKYTGMSLPLPYATISQCQQFQSPRLISAPLGNSLLQQMGRGSKFVCIIYLFQVTSVFHYSILRREFLDHLTAIHEPTGIFRPYHMSIWATVIGCIRNSRETWLSS